MFSEQSHSFIALGGAFQVGWNELDGMSIGGHMHERGYCAWSAVHSLG
jgi:hypothetical protein